MSEKHFIGIDRAFGLLVVIEALHRLTYEKVEKTLLAQAVKNTSLIYWYPESRGLPKKDPYREINPWVDDIFKEDLPQLEANEFLEMDARGVKLTGKGRSLAAQFLGFPRYSRFKEEVFLFMKQSKKSSSITRNFYEHLIQKSKRLYKEEVLYYDCLSLLEKFPIGIAFEPDKITSYIDIKTWFSSISNRIGKEEILQAPFNKTQLGFLREVCEKYSNSPANEKPLVEICGQCIAVEANDRSEKFETLFTLLVDGQAVKVIARNFCETSNVKYHAFRVIGIAQIVHGSIQVEAVKIFDRGLYFPTNGRAL